MNNSYKFLIVSILILSFYILNQYYNNDNESFLNTNYDNDDIIYIFWTGGFDSSFLIAQRLIEERKTVQPIYLTFKCDTTQNGTYYRRNRKQELRSMNNFRKIINNRYPWTKTTFLPTLYIKDVPDDPSFTNTYVQMKLFIRDISQYKHMAMYAHHVNKKIEIGSIGLDANVNDKYGKYLRMNLVLDENYPSNLPVYKHKDPNNSLHMMRYPLIYLTKKYALNRAINKGYDDLLRITWSCWFPVNDRPCGKCPMCKERIIEHRT
jgi:hypothetical protein